MKNYQPLLLSRLQIRIPGIRLHGLELHRHLNETASVKPHSHPHVQCLCYLTGHGRQQIRGRSYLVRPGTVVFLPPRVVHAFRREANRRPVCLAVDFSWRGAGQMPPKVEILPSLALRELREMLGRLHRATAKGHPASSLAVSSLLLGLLDLLLHGEEAVRPALHPGQPTAQKVTRLLQSPEATQIPLGEMARKAGFQHDHLNRRLRAETGLTLGQFRARRLLTRARELLLKHDRIGQAAAELGFSDSNYFARWFRQQTGLTPTQWRQSR